MTDEPQHTTEELGATDQTDDAQTDTETADDARLDEVEQRVEDHQAILDGLKDHLGGDGDSIGPVATRRGVLTAGSVLGLLGLGAGTASADAQGQVGTSSDPLNKLYTEELNGGVTGDSSLTNIAGSGLTIDNSGNLKTSGGSSTSQLETSGNGVPGMEVHDGGNSVSGDNESSTPPNVIGGFPGNNTDGNSVEGATIAGGGDQDAFRDPNTVKADYATVGGGADNDAEGDSSTIGGGRSNKASGTYATVPGGSNNKATGDDSFAAGNKADTNNKSGAFVWGDDSFTTATASAANEVRFQASGGFVIAPESDNPNGLEVQDKDDNAVLTVDTKKDKVDLNSNTLAGVSNIRSNGSVTVDIDADDSSSNNETFEVQANRDGTAETALSVDENAFVGINTDSPKQQLDISAANGDYIRFDGDFGHIQQYNASSSQYWTVAPRNDGRLSFANQGSDPGTGIIGDSNDVLTFQSGGEVDVQSGPLDLNGNKLTGTQSINGGVTGNTEITDLVGSGLTINNKSLETSGGGGKWTDGSSGSSWLEPSDGGDTKLEGIDTIESNDASSSLTITQDTNDDGTNSPKDLTLKTVDTGNNNYPGDIILDADPNGNDSRKISLKTGGTERATVDSNGVTVTDGDLAVTPSSDSSTTLDVQDKDGNTLLTGDTSNDKVKVAPSANGKSVFVVEGAFASNVLTVDTDSNKLSVFGTVEGAEYRSGQKTISNDDVAAIVPKSNFGKIVVHDESGNVVDAVFDVSNGNISAAATLGNGATTTGNLTGTDGTDGNLTVSADGANQDVDIENRTGSQVTVTYTLLL